MADNKKMTNGLPQYGCPSNSSIEGQEKEKENPCKDLKIPIEEIIKKTTTPHLFSKHCCIYKVSQRLRNGNESAYTPRTVSIGPLHHGDENLKAMEDVKVRYLEQFLRHAADTAHEFNELTPEERNAYWKIVDNEIRNDFSKLEEFRKILKSSNVKIRQSYAEDLSCFSDEELLNIILVDAAFIIELFLRFHFKSKGDTILSTTFLRISITLDLWLLENQVPFFVLEKLYHAAFGSYNRMNIYPPSFLHLAYGFFKDYNKQERPIEAGIKHFTDLLRTLFLPITKAKEKSSNIGAPEANNSNHSTGFLRCSGLLSKPEDDDQKQSYYKRQRLVELLKSATQLDAAGVKFRVNKSSKCLLDIKFSNPKLEIPCLHLYDNAEALYRNLMALEQYHYPTETLICDYVTLMDYLIDTREDVRLLVEKQIIINRLGSNKNVANLFNRLCTNIVKGSINQHFHHLIAELNEYYDEPWHTWKATFWRQYFSTPWICASTIAAIILLVLTLVQTILTLFTL